MTEIGEVTLVRPGSWNGAEAQDGSPEDLRDPIHVHVETGAGLPAARAPAWRRPPLLQERYGGTRTRRIVGGGSEPISDR